MDDLADIVIVGGGPVGVALALALRDTGLDIAVIEAREAAQPAVDARPLALSYGSRLILERLDVWGSLASTVIDRIHVSQLGGFGRVALHANDAGVPNLGYVVDYVQLQTSLTGALRRTTLRHICGARVTAVRDLDGSSGIEFSTRSGTAGIAAKLIVIADGGGLEEDPDVKVVDYHQSAVTSRVRSELPHRNTAFERFTSGGPVALLPYGDELAVVWTTSDPHAQELCEVSAAEFVLRLRRIFGSRLGAFTGGVARARFPLALRYSREITRQRTVLVGNAAQTLHPVAGQGFNLGLRDAYELGAEIARCRRDEIGTSAMLVDYRARRRLDRGGGVRITDTLVRLFSNDLAPLRFARGLGLTLLGCVPSARNFVIRRMIFGVRG